MKKKKTEEIINYLKEGQIVSLISDAGTPMVSDPGRILLNQCIDKNISVIPIPGPTAVITSLSISGFDEKFYFHGFLSEKENSIIKEFKIFENLSCSFIFFISAKKLVKKFELLKKFFFDREILICRELTKLHETLYRAKISEINSLQFNPKGEVTVVISGKKDRQKNKLNESDKKKIKNLIKNKSVKDIVRIFSQEKNISKSEIYNYCLEIKNEK